MDSSELNRRRFSELASIGLRVFPVRARDKCPALYWSAYRNLQPTSDELFSWENQEFNVGVICGEPSGIVVLDVDSQEAQELVDTLGLPVTPCVSTGRGRHYYFKRPDVGLRNSTRVAGVKLDVRGDGGYVVGAGSIHPSGAQYQWITTPAEAAFAEVPPNLLDILQVEERRTATAAHSTLDLPLPAGTGKFDCVLQQELAAARQRLTEAQDGERNDTLFRVGVRLAAHVAGAGADWQPFAEALSAAALQIGLGREETESTLESCWKTGSSKPTEWMNVARQWVYLSKPNVFYHPSSGQHLDIAAFNNTFASLVEKGKFAAFLLGNDLITSVFDIVYRPADSSEFIREEGLDWLNTYRASNVAAEPGDWSPFEDFVTYLVPDEEERAHLLKMIAWTVRHPGRKLRHALLLRSEHQGVGKSMLTDIWSGLLGHQNVRKTTTEEVSSQFQGFIIKTLLVVLEELNWGVGPIGYNRLKDLITADVIAVNEKYIPVRHWPNHATFVILTNLKVPLIIEEQDRRIFFIDTPALPRTKDFYAEFASWWQSNLSVIRAYIESIDLNDFAPFAPPPMTAAKKALIADGRADLVKDLALAIEQRLEAMNRDIVTLAEVEAQVGSSMRGKSRTKLVEALKALGAVPFSQQRVPGQWRAGIFSPLPTRASLWAIRNTEYWKEASAAARGEEYGRDEGRWASLDGLPVAIRHLDQWPGGTFGLHEDRGGSPLTIPEALEIMAGETARR